MILFTQCSTQSCGGPRSHLGNRFGFSTLQGFALDNLGVRLYDSVLAHQLAPQSTDGSDWTLNKCLYYKKGFFGVVIVDKIILKFHMERQRN